MVSTHAEFCSRYDGVLIKRYKKAPSKLGVKNIVVGRSPRLGRKNGGGIRLFAVYDDSRVWIDLSDGVNTWSTMKEVYNANFGHFPALREGVAEWRVTKSGEAKALIFRVDAQDPDIIGKTHSRLFVISFDKGVPKYCGNVKTNEEAVKIADRGNCTIKLDLTE